eukprot:CAMPEP_0184860320 /NCGR_PEP_ID=MMETSP0580-20130426/5228_1 /TAXON_ID=1118495 /ORGANISM="Dactyliosolen fragilissimus" /LENGTH=1729 /DNA_ID=CAMNT_0027357385 /DNA_START=146 /DNA_END=5332 /DNA_ORIENTATION=-
MDAFEFVDTLDTNPQKAKPMDTFGFDDTVDADTTTTKEIASKKGRNVAKLKKSTKRGKGTGTGTKKPNTDDESTKCVGKQSPSVNISEDKKKKKRRRMQFGISMEKELAADSSSNGMMGKEDGECDKPGISGDTTDDETGIFSLSDISIHTSTRQNEQITRVMDRGCRRKEKKGNTKHTVDNTVSSVSVSPKGACDIKNKIDDSDNERKYIHLRKRARKRNATPNSTSSEIDPSLPVTENLEKIQQESFKDKSTCVDDDDIRGDVVGKNLCKSEDNRASWPHQNNICSKSKVCTQMKSSEMSDIEKNKLREQAQVQTTNFLTPPSPRDMSTYGEDKSKREEDHLSINFTPEDMSVAEKVKLRRQAKAIDFKNGTMESSLKRCNKSEDKEIAGEMTYDVKRKKVYGRKRTPRNVTNSSSDTPPSRSCVAIEVYPQGRDKNSALSLANNTIILPQPDNKLTALPLNSTKTKTSQHDNSSQVSMQNSHQTNLKHFFNIPKTICKNRTPRESLSTVSSIGAGSIAASQTFSKPSFSSSPAKSRSFQNTSTLSYVSHSKNNVHKYKKDEENNTIKNIVKNGLLVQKVTSTIEKKSQISSDNQGICNNLKKDTMEGKDTVVSNSKRIRRRRTRGLKKHALIENKSHNMVMNGYTKREEDFGQGSSQNNLSELDLKNCLAEDEDFLSVSVGTIAGAGSVSMDKEDTGSNNLLFEDCSYLCSTALSCRRNSDKKTNNERNDHIPPEHDSSTVGAICDLLINLSSVKNRGILLSGSDKNDKGEVIFPLTENLSETSLTKTTKRDAIFTMILDVLSCAPTAFTGARLVDFKTCNRKENDERRNDDSICDLNLRFADSHHKGDSDSNGLQTNTKIVQGESPEENSEYKRTKSLRFKRIGQLSNDTHTSSIICRGEKRNETTITLKPFSMTKVYDVICSESLALLARFLSFDCSSYQSSESASRTKDDVKYMRNKMLNHGGAMLGITSLILADDTVCSILNTQNDLDLNKINISQHEDYKANSMKGTSSASNSSVDTHVDDCKRSIDGEDSISLSQVSLQEDKGDPTKKGRRSKKRRRIVHVQNYSLSELETIPESNKVHLGQTCEDKNTSSNIKLSEKNIKLQCHQNTSDGIKNSNTSTFDLSSSSKNRNTAVHHHENNGRNIEDTSTFSYESNSQPSSQITKKCDDARHEKIRAKIKEVSSNLYKHLYRSSKGQTQKGGYTQNNSHNQDVTSCSHCQNNCVDINLKFNDFNRKLSSISRVNPGELALDALNSIFTESEDDENDDEWNLEAEDEDEEDNPPIDQDALEKANMNNPLFYKNVMLRDSGSLPFLARAFAETIEAVICLVCGSGKDEEKGKNEFKTNYDTLCSKCLHHLQKRLQSLSSIIDSACCLSDTNRDILCRVNKNHRVSSIDCASDGLLVSALIRLIICVSMEYPLLHEESNRKENCNDNSILNDIILSALRTLTSLTHESNIAGMQLVNKCNIEVQNVTVSLKDRLNGIVGVINLLLSLLTMRQKLKTCSNRVRTGVDNEAETHTDSYIKQYENQYFDAIIFCLNILSNILESSSAKDARNIILNLCVNAEFCKSENKKEEQALSLLTRWIVSQTSTFREEVMSRNSSKEDEKRLVKDASENLERHEHDSLVLAGNGFIFLACLMRHIMPANETEDELLTFMEHKKLTTEIRNLVLSEIPKDDLGCNMGTKLIINTLKAFCNYYSMSIGDLSVAIVTPVMILIKDLE